MKHITSIKCLTFLLIATVILSGCQSTPDSISVVDGRNLMDIIQQSAVSNEYYFAPENWDEKLNMKGSDAVVNINAAISVPDVTAFPVYKVNQVEYDVNQVEFLVDYFTDGKDVIEYTEPTKDELEKELLIAKEKGDTEMVTYFEEQIVSAPSTVEQKLIMNWQPTKSPNGYFIEDDGIESSIYASIDTFMYMKGYVVSNSILEMNNIIVNDDIDILEEEAIAKAQYLLQELGIDYMVEVELEKAQYFASIGDAYIDYEEKLLSKGYLIKFARNVDGISGIVSHFSAYRGSEVIHYKAPLYPEEIQIFVDEEGEIKLFAWRYPLEISDSLNENVALLPFDYIQERIRDMLVYVNSYDSEPAIVTDIELNMTIISIENEPNEAMYVPAWFVYYTVEYDDVFEEGDNVFTVTNEQELVIVINAVDGGRIADLPIDFIKEKEE